MTRRPRVSLTDELCRSYLDLRWHFDPALGTRAGLVEADPRLGRFDAAAVREHLAAYRAIAGAVEELDVEDAMDEIDRTALLDEIRVETFRFEHERPQERSPTFWVLHLCDALHGLLLRPDDPAVLAPSATARLADTAAFLAQAARTVHDPPAVFVDTALELSDALDPLLTALLDIFAPHTDTAALAKAAAEAREGIERFRAHLRASRRTEANALAFAVGEDEFERRLHYQHALMVSAPEAWRYVQRLAEDLEDDLASWAGAVDPGLPWRAVAGSMDELEPAAPADPPALEEMVELLEQLRAHVADQALAPIGPGALAIRSLPRYLEVLRPQGAYLATPETRGAGAAVLLIGPATSPAERRHLAVTRGYPGQHLFQLAAGGLPTEVRRHVAAPVTVEGWSLYAVDLMEETRPSLDPGERLVDRTALYAEVVTAAADIGLHTRGWTVADAEAYLAERIPCGADRVRARIRRAALEPTRAVAAVLGRRELERLREDARDRSGAAFSLGAFHDEVLSYGGLPVSLIRWGMGLDA